MYRSYLLSSWHSIRQKNKRSLPLIFVTYYGSEIPIANASNKTKIVMKIKKIEFAIILKIMTGLYFVLIPIIIAIIKPISIRKYKPISTHKLRLGSQLFLTKIKNAAIIKETDRTIGFIADLFPSTLYSKWIHLFILYSSTNYLL